MRPHFHRPGALRALLTIAAAAFLHTPAAGQSLLDPVVDAGELRVHGGGQFLGWSERFGIDGAREPLSLDLDRASAAELVPGVAGLHSALEDLLGTTGPFRLGASEATVSQQEVRIPLSLDLGVLDRLTVGLTVPVVHTFLEADLRIVPDPDADLGLNPAITGADAVPGFLAELADRRQVTADLVTQRCGEDPASEGCQAASDLVGVLEAGGEGLARAYRSSGLFPVEGSPTGEALAGWYATLNDALVAEGLTPLSAPLPLAAAPLDHAGLNELLTHPAGPFRAAPLMRHGSRWGLGDVEARVGARLLEGERRDSAGVPTLAWSLAAIGTVRLPTGSQDSVDVFLDRGLDDGQLDLEGGAWFSLMTPRFALRARALYTRQQPGTVVTRIVPYGQALGLAGDVVEVERDPGDGFSLEVEPAFRLAPALSLALSWRMLTRGADAYTLLSALPPGDGPVVDHLHDDVALLAVGTEVSVHELGGSLTYRSRGLPETTTGGFESFFSLRSAISGSGGRVPAGIRAEFGVRLLRRLWGG